MKIKIITLLWGGGMESRNDTNEQRRRAVVEKMWLNFYNKTLFEQGLINEKQHKRMAAKINIRNRGAKK